VIIGFYGMNVGLPFQAAEQTALGIIIVMLGIIIVMMAYFAKKHWL